MKKYLVSLFVLAIIGAGFWFFKDNTGSIAPILKVGVTAGPHARIMEFVQNRGKQIGLNIEIVEFNDFILPNAALSQGEIDANSYQHQPFLDEQVKNRGYHIHSIAKTVLMPLGVYAHKIHKLSQLPNGAKVGIPNDPTNAGRALLLLQKVGLLTLKDTPNPSLQDIKTNPKNLKIIEVDGPTLPRALEDLDIAVINTDWVMIAGLDPKAAIVHEDKKSPYANVIAIRDADNQKPDIQKLVELYQSPETKTFIEKEFKGSVIAVW